MPEAADPAPPPRPAATLLLLREPPLEVLMLRRSGSGTFPSALVFPGGAIDPADAATARSDRVVASADLPIEERAARVAAVREAWEEAGVLVARTSEGRPASADPGLRDAPFDTVLEQAGAVLHLADVVPVARWITPVIEPRRFDTRFYVAAAPPDAEPSVDGREAVEAGWFEPGRLVEEGVEPLLFPTLSNLRLLAGSGSAEAAINAAAAHPPVTVTPEVEVRADGSRLIRIPGDAGYAISEMTVPR